jgi:hypothetical protein
VRMVYTVKKGGTARWLHEALSGDPSTATNLVSKLKPIPHAEADLPAPEVAAVATLEVAHHAASAGVGAGWLVTVTDTVSAGLTPGYYATDLAYDFGSETYLTDADIILHVEPAVSVP